MIETITLATQKIIEQQTDLKKFKANEEKLVAKVLEIKNPELEQAIAALRTTLNSAQVIKPLTDAELDKVLNGVIEVPEPFYYVGYSGREGETHNFAKEGFTDLNMVFTNSRYAFRNGGTEVLNLHVEEFIVESTVVLNTADVHLSTYDTTNELIMSDYWTPAGGSHLFRITNKTTGNQIVFEATAA